MMMRGCVGEEEKLGAIKVGGDKDGEDEQDDDENTELAVEDVATLH